MYWSELLWNLADGDKSQYDSLRATEVNEFFNLLKAQEKRLKAINP